MSTRRTVRFTFRCTETEKSALSHIAETFGISESAALRRVVNAMATNLELLADLTRDGVSPEGDRGSGGQKSPETTVYVHALRLIGALLTSYRESGNNGQEMMATRGTPQEKGMG